MAAIFGFSMINFLQVFLLVQGYIMFFKTAFCFLTRTSLGLEYFHLGFLNNIFRFKGLYFNYLHLTSILIFLHLDYNEELQNIFFMKIILYEINIYINVFVYFILYRTLSSLLHILER